MPLRPISREAIRVGVFHRLALREFVDEFGEVGDLALHRFQNLLHADAAYDASNQKARRGQLRRVREEILEARLLRKLRFERGLAVVGEPTEGLVDIGFVCGPSSQPWEYKRGRRSRRAWHRRGASWRGPWPLLASWRLVLWRPRDDRHDVYAVAVEGGDVRVAQKNAGGGVALAPRLPHLQFDLVDCVLLGLRARAKATRSSGSMV